MIEVPTRRRHPAAGLASRALGAFLTLLLAACAPPGEGLERSHIRFVDVAQSAGIDIVTVCGDPRRWYIPESNGTGAAWLDYDGDGDVDLFVGNGARLKYIDDGARLEITDRGLSRLYRNDGEMRFTDVAHASATARTDWTNTVATGDFDNDGDPDLYLGCFGPDVFLRNDAGRFTDATAEHGLANDAWAAGAAFGDANRDGNLDLYVANYCLFDLDAPPFGGKRNRIEGVEVAWGPEGENGRGLNPGAPDRFFQGDDDRRFKEATEQAGLSLEKPLCSYAVVFSDVDDDGWPDILVANDLQPCNLFMNQGNGRFVDQAVRRGFAFNSEGEPTSAMGLFVEDIEGDGDFDVLRTNFDLEPNGLHVNDGRGFFGERARSYRLVEASFDRLGWGGGFFDADLDGDLDLLVANGHVMPQAERIGMHPWAQISQLFEARPHRKFGVEWHDITAQTGDALSVARSARGVALGDPDDDGDIDAVIVDIDARPRLLENRSLRDGRWLGIKLRGKWSNRDGYGAKVTVHAGKRSWVREARTSHGLYSAHDPRLYFGLGRVDAVERVEIRWPSGVNQVVPAPRLDTLHVVTESDETR